MAAEIHCTECEWEGDVDDLPYARPTDAESQLCPGCGEHAGPDGCMEEGPQPVQTGPTILDAAIAGSIALDPAGSRKPAAQLLVPTLAEQEAERIRLARVIADMGRPS